MYTNNKRQTSIRFTDYRYIDKKQIDEEFEESDNNDYMNTEIISKSKFEVYEVIIKAKIMYKINNDQTFKCKDCKVKNLNFMLK